jgi:hypothetical protein
VTKEDISLHFAQICEIELERLKALTAEANPEKLASNLAKDTLMDHHRENTHDTLASDHAPKNSKDHDRRINLDRPAPGITSENIKDSHSQIPTKGHKPKPYYKKPVFDAVLVGGVQKSRTRPYTSAGKRKVVTGANAEILKHRKF